MFKVNLTDVQVQAWTEAGTLRWGFLGRPGPAGGLFTAVMVEAPAGVLTDWQLIKNSYCPCPGMLCE